MLNRLGIYISFAFWLVFGLYFGLAGILFYDITHEKNIVTQKISADFSDENATDKTTFYVDGIPFSSLEKAMTFQQEQRMGNLFRWFYVIPEKLMLFLTSMALGGLGALISIIGKLALQNAKIEEMRVFWNSLLGAMIGIIVLGISYLLPIIITTQTEVNIRPTTLIFLSLFAGLYAKRFLDFLENRFSKQLSKYENP